MNPSSLTDSRDLVRTTSDNIGPADPRYAELVRRGFNKRFEGKPEYIRLVGSADDLADAVQSAVQSGRRLAVRSGGHCLEGFVANPEVRVLIDMSLMTGVTYDPDMAAFAVEAGTTLGEMHRRLFMGWGVVLPVGQSPDIGIGGHALGSAFNFGVVTRYWFRSPGVDGRDPFRALPRAPESVVTLKAEWNWADVDERAFRQLFRNFGDWSERHSEASSPNATMFSALLAGPKVHGKIELRTMSIEGHGAEAQLDAHIAAMSDGVGTCTRQGDRSSWLAFALNPFPDLFAIGPGGTTASPARMKVKDALLKRGFSDRQIGAIYRGLARAEGAPGAVGLATYGGAVNAIPSDATAASQRASVIDSAIFCGWMDSADESKSLAWVRELYREVFAETGGVPVPGEATEGALITHPDADLADPALNTSGVPWHQMYYMGNYERLQRVKARWDPRNVFHHALSVRLPAT